MMPNETTMNWSKSFREKRIFKQNSINKNVMHQKAPRCNKIVCRKFNGYKVVPHYKKM
jgi:hypothetical protein